MSFTSNFSLILFIIGLIFIAGSGIIPGYLYGMAFTGVIALAASKPKFSVTELTFIFLLLSSSLFSVIFTNSYTPLLYFTLSILVFTSLKNKTVFKPYNKYINPIFISIVFIFYIQYQFIPLSPDGRFRGIYDDPNFVTLWFFSIIYFLYSIKFYLKKNSNILLLTFVLVFSLMIIFLTQSRMAILVVIFFMFELYLVKKERLKFLRSINVLVLILSIFLQYFLYFIFIEFIEIGNNLNENAIDRLANLNDTSNLSRVTSAYHGINLFFKQSYTSITFGSPELFSSMIQMGHTVPHNWFVQSLFVFGFFFTSLFTYLLIRIIYKSPIELLPFIGIMLLMSSILSLVAIPLMFFLLSFVLFIKK